MRGAPSSVNRPVLGSKNMPWPLPKSWTFGCGGAVLGGVAGVFVRFLEV